MTDPKPPAHARTLLLHQGELADVRQLLQALGKPFVERLDELQSPDEEAAWDLVIGTPPRLLAQDWLALNLRTDQIAICDRDSRTLRTSLRRAGVELMVRRPVHPAVLRALLLHALYRGPEKRRNARVSVGAPVTLRLGLRRQPALLADLSRGGCRLLTACALEPTKTLKILIPAEISGGKAFALRGTVLRRIDQPSGDPAFTVRFGTLRAGTRELLKRTIAVHAAGPVQLAEPVSEASGAPDRAGAAVIALEMSPQTDLDAEANRVLMGRELSLGGMRVDPSPLLDLGSDVRLAIHAGSHGQPLVVTAKVHRDDGERGVVLRFHELDPTASRQLSAVLADLPVIEPSRRDSGAGRIVSEILAGAA